MDFITDKHKRKIKKQTIIGKDGCLLWSGYKDKNGYGIMNMKSKNRKVHRVVYYLTFGSIPDGMFICHTCDNPSCINPDHLFLGTPNDNVQDMVRKGRGRIGGKPHPGQKNGMSKLTNEDVLFIRKNYKTIKYKEIAKMFGVSISCIQRICLNKSWTHLL